LPELQSYLMKKFTFVFPELLSKITLFPNFSKSSTMTKIVHFIKKTAVFLIFNILLFTALQAFSQGANSLKGGGVTLVDNGATFVMSNGIVECTIAKASAEINKFMYNGENILAGGYAGGKFYWSWNMPAYENPRNCIYTLTVDPANNNNTYAEVKLHMDWSKKPGIAAMDVDIFYSLKKGVSGIYAAARLSHPAAYPFYASGEWRMSSYPGATFDWMSIDSLRNRIMPSLEDNKAVALVPGAPKEVMRMTTGVYANQYECKYDYTADFGDLDTWGWSSTTKKIGLWMTMPSKEYYPGGPMKRELLCHVSPVLLNMLGGTHYAGGSDGAVAAGEEWHKLYGPFLIYCNKVPQNTPNAQMALWQDAIKQSKAEQAQWPYAWFTDPDYTKVDGRGKVTGKLIINDPLPYKKAYNMWVGITIPQSSVRGTTDFELWSKNYQFWVKTDAKGNFTIPNVLPGVYNMYAFGSGVAGQMTKQAFLTVTAGKTTALGNVDWTPERVAPTVWEIGIQDRTAGEFRHGKDWWVGGTYPDLHWAKFMDYPKEFPNGVNYVIGKSDWSKDWNFVQPYNVVGKEQTAPPVWKIIFDLASAPTAGSNSSLYLAAASSSRATLMVRVNGKNILPKSDTTRISFPNQTNATIRKGIHGLFGDLRLTFPSALLHAGNNEVSLTLTRSGGDIQYDYLRLESPGTTVVKP
jgi:rhamnogalacturonan endolyase